MPAAAESLTPEELGQLRACSLGKEVPVSRIESELHSLWDEDDAATRASLMNFAIYNEHLGALLENTELISEITREHACRALLIMSLTEKSTTRIRAWITAHCRLGADGKKEACSEQVAFLIESKSPDLIRNIVFSHLDSDLPLVLWWQGDFSDTFEERLYSSIDRLFVDSAAATNPSGFYDTIVRALECDGSRFTVHDLAWTRSYQFRLAVASSFDDPALLSKLTEVNSVAIHAAPGQETSALLLLAWLATQAGWQFTRQSSPLSFLFTNQAGREVPAALHIESGAAPVSRFHLKGDSFAFTVTRQPGAPYLQEEIALNGNTKLQMLPAGGDQPAALVTDQLSRGGNNRLFLKILPAFRQLLTNTPDYLSLPAPAP